MLFQEKYAQLVKATLFSSNDIISKLQPWLKSAHDASDVKTQALSSKRAKEMKQILDDDEEELYTDKENGDVHVSNAEDIVKYLNMHAHNEIIVDVAYDHNSPD